MKSEIEELCRSAFLSFLDSSLSNQDVEWKDVDHKEEPPDYYLWLDNIQYAIEVTTLMEQIDIGKHKFPAITIVASLWRIVDSVEAVAKSNKTLRGAYSVHFTRPIENLNRFRKQIYQNLLVYVENTQLTGSMPEQLIFERGRQKVTIQKINNQKSYIGKIGPTGGKWEVEVAEEICALLEERINTKEKKLRDIQFPKVLLLYDAYHFADLSMFRACLSKIINLSYFHTLFLVQKDLPGIALYSENPEWLGIRRPK